ncbi:prenyltransferase/squalene oxidase repeat-containing protein [Bacillus sp. Marseille-Q1617]|uniref:terpene cyclase/mutase family protein n=1 Tax=Bacillus sp. Marseille-Q1617 TaxID=2736887 RepID=UPI00158E4DDB|nr:prenyltransferase/squalene oxidase repeat-containing protein [Bacillus sp. Marseille-Q1617]
MKREIKETANKMVEELRRKQNPDGSWSFCFENSLLTDAYMIILIRSLFLKEDELVYQLVRRLLNMQTEEGTWKVFVDEEEGNLSATIEAYFALRFSGLLDEKDPRLKKAERFIKEKGGLEEAHTLTKLMLAVHGQYEWRYLMPIPIEVLIIPGAFPISFWDFSSYARGHIAPFLLLRDGRYHLKTSRTPNIRHLFLNTGRSQEPDQNRMFLLEKLKEGIKELAGLPDYLRTQARQFAHNYMLQRIESDGTYLSYFSTTFFMIYALMSTGDKEDSTVIRNAINGLKEMICQTDNGPHVQNSPSRVWDTALITDVLQESGVGFEGETVKESVSYLLKQQHYKFGDWAIEIPTVTPGGWGFSESNSIHPDVDDTTAALRALTYSASERPEIRQAWERGVDWVLGMQNRDGGWPAFEKNKTKGILASFPLDGAEAAAIDPSTADLTGRTLEFLGSRAGLTKDHPNMKRGIGWLKLSQEEDGSWPGRWGIHYIYGTWAAVTGMKAAGVQSTDKSIERAKSWLESIQRSDGGWGESCYSDQKNKYVPLSFSTASQTAWALDALISISDQADDAIEKGMRRLLDLINNEQTSPADSYPTGAGLKGKFYIHYHSYKWIWPLQTMSHYLTKYD